MNDPLDPSPTQRSGLAVFDFDDTLAKGDSLWPFLKKAVGIKRCAWALLCALLSCATRPMAKDKRTVIKETLLRNALKGGRLSDIEKAIEDMQNWPRWMDTVDELKRHYDAGHQVVIASGSLNLYMPAMLKDIPYHDLICTVMEEKDGVLTGEMLYGNCVRQCKTDRVKEYIEQHGPFSESWGYGNAPHDLPMMALLDHQTVVEKER